MRMILALPLLMLGACNVEKDPANDSTTYELNSSKIEDAASDVGNAAETAVDKIGNAAETAGAKIENQVDDIDVDVDVNHNKQ